MSIFQRLFGPANSAAAAKNDSYTEPHSGLVFPTELGGLRRLSAGRPYAEGDRAGESMPYGGESVQATVYVTRVAQSAFPDGGDSEFIAGELEQAMAAVRELERRGHYTSVKFFTAAPERLGTGPANLIWARAAFSAVAAGRPTFSFTYLTAWRSHVIKLRISGSTPDDKTLLEFPRALGDLISRQALDSARS